MTDRPTPRPSASVPRLEAGAGAEGSRRPVDWRAAAGRPVVPGLVQVQVVNYRRADLTLECLESIRRQTYRNFRLLVIDNASTSESRAALESRGRDFSLVANVDNLGWGAGHNAGFAWRGFATDPEFFLVVNNDAVLDPDCLAELVGTLAGDPGCAIASPMIYKDSTRTRVDNVGFDLSYRWFLPLDWAYIRGDHARHARRGSRRVTWSDDTVSLMRRADILEVGGYDPVYFMYVDETDLAYRLGKAGRSIRVNYRAAAYHGGKGSSGGEVSVFSLHCKFRNWARFHRKHFGPLHRPYAWLWLAAMFLVKSAGLLAAGRKKDLRELSRLLITGADLPRRPTLERPRPTSPSPLRKAP